MELVASKRTRLAISEAFLFFVLRFTSGEGDQTQLNALLREHRFFEELNNQHPIVSPYLRVLSPLALGFDVLPARGIATQFDDLLNEGGPFTGLFMHFPMLQGVSPQWASFIARFAYHASDVAESANIGILTTLATNLAFAAQLFLPGIDNHPYLVSFQLEPFRWLICTCGQANCVGDCGPTPESICVVCRVSLTNAYQNPRLGLRRASAQDFRPPKGLFTSREPANTATFTVREKAPIVTRLALLLNALSFMCAALNPRTDNIQIIQLMRTLPLTDQNPGGRQDDRRSLVLVLSRHILTYLDLLNGLLVTSRRQLFPDQFRIGHLILHKLLDYRNPSLTVAAQHFAQDVQAREGFEVALTNLLNQQQNLTRELEVLIQNSDGASKRFQQSLELNESSFWAYARRVFSDRQSVQLELARDPTLRTEFKFINLLLDDQNWTRKLDALCYLGEVIKLRLIKYLNSLFYPLVIIFTGYALHCIG